MDKNIQVKLTSYRLVSQELHRTLEQAKVHFESFTDDQESLGQLNAFSDFMGQINGCMRILRLKGVDALTGEILQIAANFHQTSLDNRIEQLSIISCSLIELEQYLEYIDRTESEFPMILLETVNQLRKQNGKQALPEDYYYDQNAEFVEAVRTELQHAKDVSNGAPPPERLRRLRQMYQIGLADYIRETNMDSSASMMIRSLNRTIDQNISGSHALVFRFAAAAINAVRESGIGPTRERKQLFAAIDKQFRNLTDNPQQTPKAEHCENLIRGFSYLALISGCTAPDIRGLVEQFSIKPLFFTWKDIIREREILRSPDASANRSLMRALSTELTAVKDSIELAFKTSELHGSVDFSSLIEPIKELCRIFDMAKMTDSVEAMQKILVRIEEWDIQKCILSEDEFSEIADQLTLIENQTYQLNKPTTTDKDSGTGSIQLGILQEAQQHVVSETKDGLALTKKSIDSYLDSGGDTMHLLNLTALMETVRGGTLFLGLKEVTEILKICQNYIQSNLLESREAIQHENLETLADVIISVEYYLENMDLNLNSNQKILALAEDSVKELAA